MASCPCRAGFRTPPNGYRRSSLADAVRCDLTQARRNFEGFLDGPLRCGFFLCLPTNTSLRSLRLTWGITNEVTGLAMTGENAVEQAGRDRPDLVLMDIMFASEMDGRESANNHILAHCDTGGVSRTRWVNRNARAFGSIFPPAFVGIFPNCQK